MQVADYRFSIFHSGSPVKLAKNVCDSNQLLKKICSLDRHHFVLFVVTYFVNYSGLVNSAIHNRRTFLRPAAFAADVDHLVQRFDAVDHVTEDAGELSVHVRQDYTKLGCNL